MSSIDLIAASAFTYQELTDAYNQTRVDYMVPMPMNANKLREYVITYSIDMQASAVAVDGHGVLGLAMLGARKDHCWISRLGVIKSNRRGGTGTAMVNHLIAGAKSNNAKHMVIEVIKNNVPAHTLFTKKGFQETRELLVIGRPPGPPPIKVPKAKIETVKYRDVPALLQQRKSKASWIDEYESLLNVGNIEAFRAILPDGSVGWLVYQNTVFQLGRLVIQTEVGDPVKVGRVLLHHLHREYSKKDTKSENLPADDPHWPAFVDMGYLVLFRRTEMELHFG